MEGRNNEYFSLNNLDKLAGIDEHLRFVTGLADKYHQWDLIREQIEFIQKKRNDTKLNISVIGEFTTGKSTFINALLRKELLTSSALQGTTVASTIIDYGKGYKMELQYLNGWMNENLSYHTFEDLKENLDTYTTHPAVARQLKKVKVYLPIDFLKNKFRIIDTPGTNVTEAWHEEVTVRALKEDSDLSIVLISAEKPVPSTMLHFVEKNITSILPQCVFVVTKLDLIRQRERKQVMSYIKMKLEDELEIQNAVVLPYVSPVVLGDTFDETLLQMSMETERMLVQHTAMQKTLVLTKKIVSLIDDIYRSISVKMEKLSDGYESKLELLKRTQKTDLYSFVREEKVRRLQHFDSSMKSWQNKAEEDIYSKANNTKAAVIQRLDGQSNIDELKKYISDSMGNECSEQAMNMIPRLDYYYRQIQNQFKNEMNIFSQSFVKNYQTLRILSLDMSKSQYNLPQKINIETANIASAANYIAEKLASENNSYLGGVAAGAAIGTAILPGIGTAIGAFCGIFAGAAVAPDTDAVREECKNKLKPQLTNYYNGIADKMVSALDKYIDQIRTCLSNEIDEYLNRYRSEVDRQIAYEKTQQSDVKRKIVGLQADQDLMRIRKKQLVSVINQLNQLGRKGM